MFEIVEETTAGASIKLIGVGGGGNNSVDAIYKKGLSGVECININTDIQALKASIVPHKIQIGLKTTKGVGTGSNIDLGRRSLNESRAEVAETLKNSDIVFVTCGLGGGTGTGAAPLICEIAQELGALTIAIVTSPFLFEGKKRCLQAKDGLRVIKEKSNATISIPNQKLFGTIDKESSFLKAFEFANNTLFDAISAISDLVTAPGIINLDISDIRQVIAHGKEATLAVGIAYGEERTSSVVKNALLCPLMEEVDVKSAKTMLVNITGDEDLSFGEVEKIIDNVRKAVTHSVNIVFGAIIDKKVNNKLKLTIIATDIPSLEKKEVKFISDVSGVHRKEATIKDRVMREKVNRELGGDSNLDIPTFLRTKPG
ncbi:MAG: cell division protein FtsZ [bacterium]|nr:cell division protein FtsZ [bacterium]